MIALDIPAVREHLPFLQSVENSFADVQEKFAKLIANLPLLVVAVLIVAFAMWFGSWVSRRMKILRRISNHNPYMDGLLRNIVKFLIVLGGVLIALDMLGATSLVGAVLGSAGVVGLVLGFAFKDIAENYLSGILLSIRQPFYPGDSVRIDTHEGRVVALTSRATLLMTPDGNQLLLPNATVFKSVMLNYTRNPRRRFDFSTNIDVGTSWSQAMNIGVETIAKIPGVLSDPAPSALIQNLADNGATLHFFGWIDQKKSDLSKTRSEAMRLVRRKLREAGITPPDAIQKVVLARITNEEESTHIANEAQHAGDVSVDRTLDEAVAHANQTEGGNLLDDRP